MKGRVSSTVVSKYCMILLRCFGAAWLALLIIYKVDRVQEDAVLFCKKKPCLVSVIN